MTNFFEGIAVLPVLKEILKFRSQNSYWDGICDLCGNKGTKTIVGRYGRYESD